MRRLASPRRPGFGRPRRRVSPGSAPKPASPIRLPTSRPTMPTAAELVAYLNDNAHLVQSVKSTEVEIQAKQGSESIGLTGQLFCQKPLNFRLRAVLAGQPTVDIGSNDNEFWYWISQAKDEDNVARVHYCSYRTWRPARPDAVPLPAGHDRVGPRAGRLRPEGEVHSQGRRQDDQPD